MIKSPVVFVVLSLFTFGMVQVADAAINKTAEYNGPTYHLLDRNDTWLTTESEEKKI